MKCPYCKQKTKMKRTKLKLKDYIWFICPKCKHSSAKKNINKKIDKIPWKSKEAEKKAIQFESYLFKEIYAIYRDLYIET